MIRSNGWFWVGIFILCFGLTQDYIWGQWTPETGLLGLPAWLWWFIGVHVFFIVAFYLFSKYYWKED